MSTSFMSMKQRCEHEFHITLVRLWRWGNDCMRQGLPVTCPFCKRHKETHGDRRIPHSEQLSRAELLSRAWPSKLPFATLGSNSASCARERWDIMNRILKWESTTPSSASRDNCICRCTKIEHIVSARNNTEKINTMSYILCTKHQCTKAPVYEAHGRWSDDARFMFK